ncbi:hypothetical protein PIIN_09779 [Serendipita indica DSM 11827]|uniref:Uncharacterized protein n=1 Tax=Serendipita indica (strain DSM 11827) TaxID=1109443 RepID=G4TWU8_SERID|nr:hypothetical protein PIIN_09779 [Serendipita indica DSM 11827]
MQSASNPSYNAPPVDLLYDPGFRATTAATDELNFLPWGPEIGVLGHSSSAQSPLYRSLQGEKTFRSPESHIFSFSTVDSFPREASTAGSLGLFIDPAGSTDNDHLDLAAGLDQPRPPVISDIVDVSSIPSGLSWPAGTTSVGEDTAPRFSESVPLPDTQQHTLPLDGVEAVFWDKEHDNLEGPPSAAAPTLWNFSPRISNQRIYIEPSSNEQFTGLLMSPHSQRSQSISYLDYEREIWKTQKATRPIEKQPGRPLLLRNYRLKGPVNWAEVEALTGYTHKPSNRFAPYTTGPKAPPTKKKESWFTNKPAKGMLENLNKFEDHWERIKGKSKHGTKDKVQKLFRSHFPEFDGSVSTMDRARRAAKDLPEKEYGLYMTKNANKPFGEVINLVESLKRSSKPTPMNHASPESPRPRRFNP